MAHMTRREFREHIVRLLYLAEFHEKEELEEQFRFYCDLFEIPGEEVEPIHTRFFTVRDRLPEVDRILQIASTGWTLQRMCKTDLAVLRLAVYEMRFDPSIPEKVSINEAVDIARKFGGQTSFSFVNGVLAKIVTKEPEKESENG